MLFWIVGYVLVIALLLVFLAGASQVSRADQALPDALAGLDATVSLNSQLELPIQVQEVPTRDFLGAAWVSARSSH